MAITANDVTNALNPIIQASPFDDGAQVINLGDGSFVYLSMFVTLFGSAVDMTAASLNAVDAGKMGYANHITEWQQKGYIK